MMVIAVDYSLQQCKPNSSSLQIYINHDLSHLNSELTTISSYSYTRATVSYKYISLLG